MANNSSNPIKNFLNNLFGWVSAAWAIPAISLIVTVDQWVSATGAADPYQFDLLGKPFSPMAAARGIAIVLSVSYVLRQVRILWKRQGERRLVVVLTVAVLAMLLIEISVITPWIVTAMAKTDMAVMLTAWQPFDLPLGKILYAIWSMFVATISLLAVGAASLATFVSDKPATSSNKGDGKNDGAPGIAPGVSFEQFVADQDSRNGNGVMSAEQVMEHYGLSERTAYRWLKRYKDERNKPGVGVA